MTENKGLPGEVVRGMKLAELLGFQLSPGPTGAMELHIDARWTPPEGGEVHIVHTHLVPDPVFVAIRGPQARTALTDFIVTILEAIEASRGGSTPNPLTKIMVSMISAVLLTEARKRHG